MNVLKTQGRGIGGGVITLAGTKDRADHFSIAIRKPVVKPLAFACSFPNPVVGDAGMVDFFTLAQPSRILQ